MRSLELFCKKKRSYDMVEDEFITTQPAGSGLIGFYPTAITYEILNKENKPSIKIIGDNRNTMEPQISYGFYPKYLNNKTYIINLKSYYDIGDGVFNGVYFSTTTKYYHQDPGTIHETLIEGDKKFFNETLVGIYITFKWDVVQSIGDLYIYDLTVTDKFYTRLDTNDKELIKITKTLKDIREPEKNNAKYSKTFLLPVTETNDEYFEYFSHDDLSFKGKINHECYISYDGINNLYGEILLDKIVIGNSGEKYYQCIFIGENKTLFNLLKTDQLYNLSPTTYENLNYDTIWNSITGITTGEEAYAADSNITYGIFERGEDILGNLTDVSCITQGSYLGNYTGLTVDSFTPAFWVWWLFEEIHNKFGYTVKGDFLTDTNYLNMVMPITRKNWWENPEEINTSDYLIEEWTPTIPVKQFTPLFNNSETFNIASILSSTTYIENFWPTTPSAITYYAYYRPFELTLVRQKLKFDIDVTIEAAGTSPVINDIFFELYAHQETGGTSSYGFEKILIERYKLVTTLESGNLIYQENFTIISDYLSFWYKNEITAITYFSVDIVVEDASFTNSWAFAATADFTINTYNDGYEDKIRVDRYPGSQIGTFSYPQDISYSSVVEDVMKMFNLVVDVDELKKEATYYYWRDFGDGIDDIQNLSSNIILNKKIEKSFTNYITPDIYDFKFKIDENDYLTNYDLLDPNPSELILTTNDRNDKTSIVEPNSTFLYEELVLKGTPSITQINNGLRNDDGTKITGDSAINYNFSNNYYCFYKIRSGSLMNLWSIDLLSTTATTLLPLFKNNITGATTNDILYLSYGDVSGITNNYTGETLYTEYWEDIIELINSPTTYILTAYFYLSVLEFYNLSLFKKVRIGNNLYYINKIFDWAPDSPTKIELIKITNIDIGYNEDDPNTKKLISNQNPISQCTFTFQLPYGNTIYVDWGDGNVDTVEGNDLNDVTIISNYTVTGTYDVKISGNYIDLTTIDISNNSNISGDISYWSGLTNLTNLYCYSTKVTFDNISTWSMSGIIDLYDNEWTSTMVDNALVSFAAQPVIGCTINLGGTNSARTSASDADVVIIESGNTLTVNDNNFSFLTTDQSSIFQNTFTFQLPTGKTMYVDWGDNNISTFNGSGTTDVSITSTYTLTATTYNITLFGDYLDLTKITIYSQSNTSGDVSGWSSLINLTHIDNYFNSTTGDISSWSSLINLTYLNHSQNSTSGDISGWSGLTNLTYLVNYSNSTSGDVSGWSSLINLTYLSNINNSTSGDVSGWSSLINLTYLDNGENSTTGDVSGWSSLTGLIYLNNSYNSTNGDVSDWSGLTNLFELYNITNTTTGDVSGWSSLTGLTQLYNVDNSTTFDSTPTWSMSGIIDLYDNNWTSQMVDNVLASFAASPLQNCIIDIAGTNSARTSASDADKAIIIDAANNNTLDVNDY